MDSKVPESSCSWKNRSNELNSCSGVSCRLAKVSQNTNDKNMLSKNKSPKRIYINYTVYMETS